MKSDGFFRKFIKLIKNLICGFAAFCMFGAAVTGLFNEGGTILRFAQNGMLLSARVFFSLFMILFCFFCGLFFVRCVMGNKAPEKFTYLRTAGCVSVCLAFAVLSGVLQSYRETSYRYLYYLPSVETGMTKHIKRSSNLPFDSEDKIEINAYFNFVGGGFADADKVTVETDETLGDRVDIYISYKGDDCYADAYFYGKDEYEYKEYSELYVSLYPKYSRVISDSEYAQYYKQGIMLDYADRFAVCSVRIVTAHPEKLILNIDYGRNL